MLRACAFDRLACRVCSRSYPDDRYFMSCFRDIAAINPTWGGGRVPPPPPPPAQMLAKGYYEYHLTTADARTASAQVRADKWKRGAQVQLVFKKPVTILSVFGASLEVESEEEAAGAASRPADVHTFVLGHATDAVCRYNQHPTGRRLEQKSDSMSRQPTSQQPTSQQQTTQQQTTQQQTTQQREQLDGRQHEAMQHEAMQHEAMQHDGRQHEAMQHDGRQHEGRQHEGRQLDWSRGQPTLAALDTPPTTFSPPQNHQTGPAAQAGIRPAPSDTLDRAPLPADTSHTFNDDDDDNHWGGACMQGQHAGSARRASAIGQHDRPAR